MKTDKPIRQTIDEAVDLLEKNSGCIAGRIDVTREGFYKLRNECANAPEENLIFVDNDGNYFYRGMAVVVHEAVH